MEASAPVAARPCFPVWLMVGLLVLGTVLAYQPVWRAGFIWDDDAYVTQNAMLTAPDGLSQIWFSAHRQSQYFPLVYTTLRFERALWGLNPQGYHAVNVLLHAVNALLLWQLLRRLAVPGAWLAAAIFALHPVQVESVAWITELKNVQSTLFYLLALLAWVKFVGKPAAPRVGLLRAGVVVPRPRLVQQDDGLHAAGGVVAGLVVAARSHRVAADSSSPAVSVDGAGDGSWCRCGGKNIWAIM